MSCKFSRYVWRKLISYFRKILYLWTIWLIFEVDRSETRQSRREKMGTGERRISCHYKSISWQLVSKYAREIIYEPTNLPIYTVWVNCSVYWIIFRQNVRNSGCSTHSENIWMVAPPQMMMRLIMIKRIPQYLNRYLLSSHYLFPVRINLRFFFSSLLPAFATLLSSLLFTSISTDCKFLSQPLINYPYIPIMLFSPFIYNFSPISSTCVSLSRSPLLISIFLKKCTMLLKESTVTGWW